MNDIAEGSGRFHKAEKRNFYVVVRGSAYECIPLLKIAHDGLAIDSEKHSELREKLMELVKMLTKLEQSVDVRKNKD